MENKQAINVIIPIQEYEELQEFKKLTNVVNDGNKIIHLQMYDKKRHYPVYDVYINFKELDENHAISILEKKIQELESKVDYSGKLNDALMKVAEERNKLKEQLKEALEENKKPFWKRKWKIS